MLFNTQAYAIFFALVFVAFWLLRRFATTRVVLLLVASFIFYGAWNWKYLGLILFSTLLDYSLGLAIGNAKDPVRRKRLMAVSLVGNLGVLCVFKYYDFFVRELAELLTLMGFQPDPSSLYLNVILPVGISFYTFQTLSYTIDVYRGQLEPERNVLNFALFVAFFPQLVAGPIVRARHFLPQIGQEPRLDGDTFNRGLSLIFWGLFKKVLIADYLGGTLVDPFWRDPGSFGGFASVVGIYGYAFQVYGDFSGYSDIAIGSARLLGFDLGENFHSPYRTCSLKEHWQRWHISLSTWLRDYLYIPLGGNRGGFWSTNRNLMITMFLGGLWHGVGTTFLVWGLYQGALLVGERLVDLQPQPANAVTRWGRRLYAFHATCAGYILFRSQTFDQAEAVARSIFASRGTASHAIMPLCVLVLAVLVHLPTWGFKTAVKDRFVALPGIVQGAVYALLVGLMMNVADMKAPFIYFQF